MLINEHSSHSELLEGFFLEDKNNKTKQTEPLKPNLFQSLYPLFQLPLLRHSQQSLIHFPFIVLWIYIDDGSK